MKKLVVKEAAYTIGKEEKQEVENVEKINEHVVLPTHNINLLINENKLNEETTSMKAFVNKEEFKNLFGPKKKPKKGDVLSITNLAKKYKVKRSKKFKAGKKGRGYKISLEQENA